MEEANQLTIEVQILQSSMDVEVTPTVAMDPNKLGVRTLAPFISSISTQTDRELERANNYNSVVLEEQYVNINHLSTEERKVDKSGFNWIATTTEMLDSSSDEEDNGGNYQHKQRQRQRQEEEQQQQGGQQTVKERIKELTEEDLLLHSNGTVNLCFHESNPMEAIAAGKHVSIVSNRYTLEMRNSQMANAAGCDYDVRSIVANKFSTRHLLPETNELDFVQPTEAGDQPTGTEAGLDLGLDLDLLSQMEDEDDRDTTGDQSVGAITVCTVDNEDNVTTDNGTVIEVPSINELIALHEMDELNEFQLQMADHDYTMGGTKASTVGYSPSVSPRTRLAGITSAGATPAMTTSARATPALATPTPVVPLRPEVRRAIGTGAAASTTPSPGPRYSPSHLFADIGHSRVAINASTPKMPLSIANVSNLASISPTPTTSGVAGEVSQEGGDAENDKGQLKRLQTLRVPSLSLMNASGSSWGSATAGTMTVTATPATPAGSPASDSENEDTNNNDIDDEKAEERSSLKSICTVEVINLREINTKSEKRVSGVSGHGLDGLDGLGGLGRLDGSGRSGGGVNAATVANALIGPDGRVIARAAPKESDVPPAPPVTRAPSRRGHGKSNSHTRTNTNYGLIFVNEQQQNQDTDKNKSDDKDKDSSSVYVTTTNNKNVNTKDNSARMKTVGKRIYHYRKTWTRPKATKTTTMKASDRHTVIVSGTKIIYPKSARRYDNENDNDENKKARQEIKRHTLPEKTAPPVMHIDNNDENEASSDDEDDDDIPFPDYRKNTGGNQSAPLTGGRHSGRQRRRSITRLRMGIPPRPRHTPRARERAIMLQQPTIDENDINMNDESIDSIGDIGSMGSMGTIGNNTRRESSHIRMGTVQVVSTDIDSKRELIAALGKITTKFDSLFPFYRLSDKDCKHLSLMVYQQFDSINRIFCNAHGRYLEALIYYKGSLVPEKLAFFNYDDLWGEVKQWHDIKMGEKYCLTEMGFSPNDRRRTF